MRGIDYSEVKQTIDTAAVLRLVGFAPRRRLGDELRGYCPVCRQTRGRGTFAINLQKKAWQCFSCGKKGNLLDLWVAVTGQALYQATLDLCRRLGIGVPTVKPNLSDRSRESEGVR